MMMMILGRGKHRDLTRHLAWRHLAHGYLAHGHYGGVLKLAVMTESLLLLHHMLLLLCYHGRMEHTLGQVMLGEAGLVSYHLVDGEVAAAGHWKGVVHSQGHTNGVVVTRGKTVGHR